MHFIICADEIPEGQYPSADQINPSVSKPIPTNFNQILVNLMNKKDKCLKRGDTVQLEYYGCDRNEGTLIWDGNTFMTLDNTVDEYGAVPSSFRLFEAPDFFRPDSFTEGITHNNITWMDLRRYLDQIKENVDMSELSTYDEKEWFIHTHFSLPIDKNNFTANVWIVGIYDICGKPDDTLFEEIKTRFISDLSADKPVFFGFSEETEFVEQWEEELEADFVVVFKPNKLQN